VGETSLREDGTPQQLFQHPEATMKKALSAIAAAALVATLAACASSTPADDTTSDSSGEPTLSYVTEGKLTIATGEPAYFPYVIDDAPESGDGFESAVAYAVADQLGFAADDVVWVRTGFDEAIQPGPKTFDFNLQQFSITDERKATIDFSSPYYSTPQAVITIDSSPVAGATSIADLADAVIGAQTGTTSLETIGAVIKPSSDAQVFNTNEDAVLALQSGQIDALVVDLPTAFYLTGVELDGGVLIGQLPAADGVTDDWGLVLDKDSTLTPSVTAAVDALREDGTLDEIASEWLGADAGAPVLE
jgi:polar amino acid transport system substrate-binding protein